MLRFKCKISAIYKWCIVFFTGQMLFNYYEETYLQFMQGADTFEELEENLEKQIRTLFVL